MSLRASKTYLLTLVVFFTGTLISLKTGDWSWFSRSGSAVVVIGLLLTSHEIFERNRRLREHRRNREERLSSNGEQEASYRANRDWADANSFHRLIRSRSREEAIWEIEMHGFYLLVAGTLVWGFGDLLGLVFA